MSSNIFISPLFVNLGYYINTIPENFNNIGTVLKDGRNELRVVEIDGVNLVIKSFKRHTLANKVIYRFFRKSKARRSYENALKLSERKICTPSPVAYIDIYSTLFLKSSYYISCFVNYEKVESLLSDEPSISFLEDLGEFVYNLHEKEVFHYDLHTSNILSKKNNEGKFNFCLVDINRLKFLRASKNRRVKNLNRLDLPFNHYSIVISKYADLAKFNAFSFAHKQLYHRKKHRILRSKIRTFKNFYKKTK